MKNVGLITYHSAYNYGSALQAYATQEAIQLLGHDVEIINYRMAEQNYFYKKLYHFRYGKTAAVRDLLQIPMHSKRILRARNFEAFMRDYLILTNEMSEPEQISSMWDRYDVIVSGSDQIWNKDSVEFRHNDLKYMDPYLLKGFKGKKVSYASSVGTLDREKLRLILSAISGFDAISFREKKSTDFIANELHRNVENVLDPTFLLDKQQWITRMKLKEIEKDYILYYSLTSYKDEAKESKHLVELAEKYRCRVIVITPLHFAPVYDRRIEYRPDYGPREFLELLYNAKLVITYSFHGTALSANLNVPFYSLAKKTSTDYRKADLLGRLGLRDRIAYGLEEVLSRSDQSVDFKKAGEVMEKCRSDSLRYLSENLE